MKSRWFRSIAAQFIGFTLLALIISQALTFVISWDERSKALKAAMKSEFFSRSTSITQLMETIPLDMREQALLASETSYSRFWLTDEEPRQENAWRSRASTELSRPLDNFVDLTRKYGSTTMRPPQFDLAPIGSAHAGGMWARASPVLWNLPQQAKFLYFGGGAGYGLAVELSDGRWLNAATYKPQTNGWWTSTSLTSLGLTALILSVIGALIASRLAKPLKNLATSAEALGRGENLPALPESGPDEIRRTAEAFNRMQSRLHRFVEDRTRMLAAIGHDLRTPLTSLRLRAEFVQDVDVKDKMISTLDEMQSMTEAAISFARGESAVEVTRDIELGALVESICDDQADMGHPVQFIEGDKFNYRCRPDSLKRAVRNLIENAVRYGVEAKVSIRQTVSTVEIVVEDRGPGVPEAMRERVFEPFVRMETSRNRETGGIGLGLSIARAAARQHGGDILLQSNDKGMLAVISLPKDGSVKSIANTKTRHWRLHRSALKVQRSGRYQGET